MSRKPSDDPKVHTVSIRLTKSERKMLDERRGAKSVTEYAKSKLLGRR